MAKISRKNRLKMTSVVSWSVTGLLLAVIFLVIAYAATRKTPLPSDAEKKAADVEVMTVQPETYKEELLLPARVKADATGVVSPEFSGRLKKWHVPEGGFVEKGQIVAEFETDTLEKKRAELQASRQSTIQNAEAVQLLTESAQIGLDHARKQQNVQELTLKAARSEMELARKEFERFKNLAAKKVVDQSRLDAAKNAFVQASLAMEKSEQALDSARLSVAEAEKKVKEAQANLKYARSRIGELDAAINSVDLQMEKTVLYASVSGNLEEHLVKEGEVAGAEKPIARIYDLRHVRASVNVPDRYVAFLNPKDSAAEILVKRLSPGAVHRVEAQLVIPGLPKLTDGKRAEISLDADIVRIAQAADSTSNTFEVELRLPNPGSIIREGFIGQGRIVYLTYPDAVVIPLRSVQVTDEGPRVVVAEKVDGKDVARIRDIDPISVRDDRILVRSGLKPGDRLVLAGWKGLVEGEIVNVLVEDGRFIPLNHVSKNGEAPI